MGSTVSQLAIFSERRPRTEYILHAEHVKRTTPKPDPQIQLPESPLYSPFDDFQTIRETKKCSPKTIRLIQLCKTLTDVATEIHHANIQGQSGFIGPIGIVHNNSLEDAATARARLYHIVWDILDYRKDEEENNIYEAIRLCARLYASAIWYNIPLSTASRPAAPDAKVQHVFCGVTPAMIRHVLARTDLFNCWDEMIGVLLWVTLVSGAAAAAAACSSNTSSSEEKGKHIEASSAAVEELTEAEATRKWLIALSMRCSILLSFERTAAVMESLQRLLDVQCLLSKGPRS